TTNGIATFNNNVVVADGFVTTMDQLNVNNAVINTKATVKQLQVDTTSELKGNVTIPTAKLTTATLQTTGTSTFNVVNTTGTTTATGVVNTGSTSNATNVKGVLNVTGITNANALINANQGITIPTGKTLTTDLASINTLTVNTAQTNNGTTIFNNTVTINSGKILNANGTNNLTTLNVSGVTTATGVVNLGSTSNATNVKGTLITTGAVTNNSTQLQKGKLTVQGGTETNNLVVTGSSTLNSTTTNSLAINTTTLQKGKLTAQAGIDLTAGDLNVTNNIKGNVLWQNGKTLDEIYLQKYQGSTGVAALNIPRETGFLVQRNTTEQITTNRCIGYEDMLFDEQTKRFYLDGIVNFYPDVNSLKFKGTDNFIQFDCYKEIINNKHLFVAFDVNEIPTKEKDLLTIELSDSKKIIFKINEELKLAIYLDSVKLNESDIFKDIDILRECFGLIIKNEKLFLIHDGETKAQFNLSGIKNQTIKLITIGSKTNSLLFDLYTLMIGNFDNSQWSNLEVGTYYINNQYSQEVYQCFGNFKYNENLDKVNFSFESSALPNATLLQKGIVKLTNTIEDREDLAVTPRALIDFNVQSIYESKYNEQVCFNIKKGLTDTVSELKPNGYSDLNLGNCLSDGKFSSTNCVGQIDKKGLYLQSTNKLSYTTPSIDNWVCIIQWNISDLKTKTGEFKLFNQISFGELPNTIKQLENNFKNVLVIHANGNCFFNGSKLSNITTSYKMNNISLISTLAFRINSITLLKNITYQQRELEYISKYGYEVDNNIEIAPLYNTACNWNQLRQVINHTEKQIQGLKSKLITKELTVSATTLSFSEITESVIGTPEIFVDGELLSANFVTWNSNKSITLKSIVFTHKKQVTVLYKYRVTTNII
ncbi:MAG: hypothetical protein ACRC1M_02930, partial [Methanobacteriaceae archaeon]